MTAVAPFRPRARLLQLLGDQLIGNARLALFELVKNAYDADANQLDIVFENLEKQNPRIVVTDDGEGMPLSTLQNIWFEPGADHRELQRKAGKRTKKFNRLPLGEKGVGRFAVHKLGNKITLITRAENEPEYTIDIDWHDLVNDTRYMDEANVRIVESNGSTFKQGETGTKIIISELRETWSRGDIRRLWANVKSISSPFKEEEVFRANLSVPGKEEWLSKLPDVQDILDQAIWHYCFWFEDGKFEWEYKFKPIDALKIKGRSLKSEKNATLQLAKDDQKKYGTLTADKTFTDGIGPVCGEFYIFDRDAEIMSLMTNTNLLKDFLDENGGIRVYRDGIRVHNYGEKGVDWLGLDLRRVNVPTRRISNNLIIGAIDLSLKDSQKLVEKTNREGFVESSEYERLRSLVLASLIEFENHRQEDKQQINLLLDHAKGKSVLDIHKPIEELRDQIEKRKLGGELGKYVDTIERQYNEMKEVVTHSGVANISLAIVFHEIERGVKSLNTAIKSDVSFDLIKRQADDLSNLLEGFSMLLRRDGKKRHDIKDIVKESLFLNKSRTEYHNVTVSCPLLTDEQRSFECLASRAMLLGALSNLIDNALYWMRVRWPDAEYQHGEKKKRAIYIGVTDFFEDGQALIIADNGPGIKLKPADIVKPFMTTKPDGMGLGMYYTNMVMELNGGRIAFPDREDVNVPAAYDGAVIALVFKKDE
ncbi:ATP-binding protein [Micavibrio aeruginosavorus]|uniref:ATP-binding region, ATPase-like protein n=1 Tax=Micavibrio aeruginosavorus EPB TaxID=349215 RepID=M4VIE8_9BACT|nr:ATP-binding protein [Micavibrio aeruginosavorus]AGH97821.1 ATP-binding region, ATPase-like protein [Micavibrio aeruginosavorus EPB]